MANLIFALLIDRVLTKIKRPGNIVITVAILSY